MAEPPKSPKPMKKMVKPGATAAGESIGGAKVMKKPARRSSVLPGGLSTAAPAPAADATTSYTGGAAPATSPKPVKTMKKPERRSSVLAGSAQGGSFDEMNKAVGSTDSGTKAGTKVMKKPARRASQLPGLMPTGDNSKPTLPLEMLIEEKETVSEPVTPISDGVTPATSPKPSEKRTPGRGRNMSLMGGDAAAKSFDEMHKALSEATIDERGEEGEEATTLI